MASRTAPPARATTRCRVPPVRMTPLRMARSSRPPCVLKTVSSPAGERSSPCRQSLEELPANWKGSPQPCDQVTQPQLAPFIHRRIGLPFMRVHEGWITTQKSVRNATAQATGEYRPQPRGRDLNEQGNAGSVGQRQQRELVAQAMEEPL